jgi:LysM repeat protein
MLIGLNAFAQPTNSEEVDDSTYVELIEGTPRKTFEIPPFQLINPDTLKLGEHDELVCDSYTALGMPYVYDALHSFNARRMDKFGGYLNVKINQGLENIRKKGFNSDVKQLYIQVNPKTLTVHWVAVVGPSEDGKCYVRVDSRGSAGGGLPAVNKQLPRMHNLYPTLNSVKLLEFNENVIKCYDWNGNRLDSVCTFVNIRQHFFKYYDSQIGNTITLEDYVAKYPYTTDGEQLPGTKKFVAPTYRTYKVKSGDSLSTIAAKYHTTVSKIKKANGLRSDLIRIGQVLKIPT